jgi:hypothetical protein
MGVLNQLLRTVWMVQIKARLVWVEWLPATIGFEV